MFVLLPDKLTKAYEEPFKMLINLCNELNPTSISFDVKLAVINAVKIHFLNIINYGYSFYFIINLKKKLVNCIISKYNSDFISVKMIIVIAFSHQQY